VTSLVDTGRALGAKFDQKTFRKAVRESFIPSQK